ncbi:hypothetical protein ACLOJK_037031, partial [Asimina triloba]
GERLEVVGWSLFIPFELSSPQDVPSVKRVRLQPSRPRLQARVSGLGRQEVLERGCRDEYTQRVVVVVVESFHHFHKSVKLSPSHQVISIYFGLAECCKRAYKRQHRLFSSDFWGGNGTCDLPENYRIKRGKTKKD